MRGNVMHVNQWAGTVVAVDGIALRIRASWYRLALSTCHASGEQVIPWSRVDRVQIEGSA
jgi:hypothetical protein